MSDKDAYIKKHQKLTSIVCCPECHRDLSYPDGDFYLDIPIASKVVCNQCGEVGQI